MLGIVALAVAAFAWTNIDDLLIISTFLSNRQMPIRHVVLGQSALTALVHEQRRLGHPDSIYLPTHTSQLSATRSTSAAFASARVARTRAAIFSTVSRIVVASVVSVM